MARGRAWAPSRVGGQPPISASLRPNELGAGATWSTNPKSHIVVYRPTCTVPGCREPSMVWARCGRCRAAIGRCHHHEPDNTLAAARAAHQETHG